MALPAFTNEAAFRTQWIAPLLSKLGYILVNHTHGSGEQGKDFFFADYDQFEHRRFYAVQAKNGNLGAGDVELDQLLNQVRRSFAVKLRFHKEADDKRISAVYIMAAGKISREAREYISDWCKEQMFGENVYHLDGDTLERLDKHAFQQFDRDLRNRLIGVRHECEYNTAVLTTMHVSFQQRSTLHHRNRHLALDALLALPPPAELLSLAVLDVAWQYLTRSNRICDAQMIPISWSAEQWEAFVEIVKKAITANAALREATKEAIRKLDEKYAIAVEVIE